jgi:hypothetical protein
MWQTVGYTPQSDELFGPWLYQHRLGTFCFDFLPLISVYFSSGYPVRAEQLARFCGLIPG